MNIVGFIDGVQVLHIEKSRLGLCQELCIKDTVKLESAWVNRGHKIHEMALKGLSSEINVAKSDINQ